MPVSEPDRTRFATHGMVCSVDHLASSTGISILREGGSAADAAVATSAVLAVTTQHMSGMGGDLFALVHDGVNTPSALMSVGRAGSGADPVAMRGEGLTVMPYRSDVRSATVPGCVDGWLALHGRHGRLPLADVLEPARRYAEDGFPASPLLERAAKLVAHLDGADDYRRAGGLRAGQLVRRPLVAEALAAIGADGRDGFYGGPFGEGLMQLGAGLFSPEDLQSDFAEWTNPLSMSAWGHQLWTVPPPSQGYLSLAGAWIAEGLDLPDDPDDAGWAHLLSEAARMAAFDRPNVLFDGADGVSLLAEGLLAARRAVIDPTRRVAPPGPAADGGTIYLCAVDDEGMGVSLMQSNAADWGCHLVVPGTGIFLHNRGIGFRLDDGHPAELGPGRRPPHTLAPALVTAGDGSLKAVLGTMGGDIQPQVVLQLLARLLHHNQTPGQAVQAPRWTIGGGGFDSWEGTRPQITTVEHQAPVSWERGLAQLGHQVVRAEPGANVGHAHAIVIGPDKVLAGAADPRALTGAACGY